MEHIPDKIQDKRLSGDDLNNQIDLFNKDPLYSVLFDKIPDSICIVNKYRQVVFANSGFRNYFGINNMDDVYGLRPGETLKCQNAYTKKGQCGASDACPYCGIFLSFLAGIKGYENSKECSILQKDNGDAMVFNVHSSPFKVSAEDFVIFTMIDISDQKRREILERVFFHDILNTASGLYNIAELLETELPPEFDEYKKMVKASSQKLLDEIEAQKLIINAEKGKINVLPREMNTNILLSSMIKINSNYDFAKNIELKLAENSDDFMFVSDHAILGRILTNLIKNALEAEYPDGKVEVSARKIENRLQFNITNSAFMKKEIQTQIFRKSFSTKGQGRGIGTYSIKMFTERFLKGTVAFYSTKEHGTTFCVELPLRLDI